MLTVSQYSLQYQFNHSLPREKNSFQNNEIMYFYIILLSSLHLGLNFDGTNKIELFQPGFESILNLKRLFTLSENH